MTGTLADAADRRVVERSAGSPDERPDGRAEARPVPAWLRRTEGEARWPVGIVVAVAIALQLKLPRSLTIQPHGLLPALEGGLLAVLFVADPWRISRSSPRLRTVSIGLIAVITAGNAWSAGHLVHQLFDERAGDSSPALLATGGAIWLTNVIVFALWYWELDRGGPAARAAGERAWPDFQFPQMEDPHLAPPDWEPEFVDYLYVSFTNATAFSPTDVMPLTRWAKLMMLVQSAVSLVTVALVIARAVNILR